MSYDLTLVDKKTGVTLELQHEHQLHGGTFVVGGTKECWLNITYNYARYFYEAADGDERFMNKAGENIGINALAGVSGLDSLPMLIDLTCRIISKYQKDGKWIKRMVEKRVAFYDGKEILDDSERTRLIAQGKTLDYADVDYLLDEGDTRDYWQATAANAVEALKGLIALAQARPDGIWRVQ